MINKKLEIRSNREIADRTYEMILEVPADIRDGEKTFSTEELKPGQFINIKIEGFYLRRPISICSWDEKSITIIYKTVGAGTETMSRLQKGDSLEVLLPLGNGYDIRSGEIGKFPVLIGGGAGVPPMYGLCRELAKAGAMPTVILGFKAAGEIFYTEKFRELGVPVMVATEDGSQGVKGFVTDLMSELDCTSFFACGPEGMLKAIDRQAKADLPGWLSFEERMGCGFGACMGCSCETKYGNKRICKEGPVLERREIIW